MGHHTHTTTPRNARSRHAAKPPVNLPSRHTPLPCPPPDLNPAPPCRRPTARPKPHPMTTRTRKVAIHGLAAGGDGVGRDADGKVAFVPLTAPGDVVLAEATSEHEKRWNGRLVEIVEPGEGRVEPPCTLFGICGGCQWQHLAPEIQTEWKGRIVRDSLRRIGRLDVDDLVRSHPPAARLRTRSRCRVGVDRTYNLGFQRTGSRSVVPFQDCPVLVEGLADRLTRTREVLSRDLVDIDSVAAIMTIAGEDGAAVEVQLQAPRSGLPDSKGAARLAELLLEEAGYDRGAVVQWSGGERSVGRGWVSAGQPAVRYAPGGFAQASFLLNPPLVEAVLGALPGPEDRSVVELYAGCGNFSLPLAAAGAKVHGMDSSRSALRRAGQAAAAAGLDRATFSHFDDRSPQRATTRLAQAELLLVDPPRSGLSPRLLDLLPAEGAKRLVYVSCHPAVLGRDCRRLVDRGYELRSVDVLDLMPQTWRPEAVAVLDRPGTRSGSL